MAQASMQRHHQVQPFSACQFGPALMALIVKQAFEVECGLHHEIPGCSWTWIKIEHQPIGMLDVINRCRPRMQLDRVHRHKPEQSLDIIHPHAHALAALSLLDAELMHAIRDQGQSALVIKRRTMRMPHQLKRTVAEETKRPLPYPLPITSQLFL